MDSIKKIIDSYIDKKDTAKRMSEDVLTYDLGSRLKYNSHRLIYQNIITELEPINMVGDELIHAYDEYINLLGDEIRSMIGIANAHGWKSKSHNKGRLLRDKIDSLKTKI